MTSNQPREQARIWKGYSTTDNIHFFNQEIEKSAEYNQPLYIAFVEGERTLDYVEVPVGIEAL